MTTCRKSSLGDRCFSETRRIKGWILIPDSFSSSCCASPQYWSQGLWYLWEECIYVLLLLLFCFLFVLFFYPQIFTSLRCSIPGHIWARSNQITLTFLFQTSNKKSRNGIKEKGFHTLKMHNHEVKPCKYLHNAVYTHTQCRFIGSKRWDSLGSRREHIYIGLSAR